MTNSLSRLPVAVHYGVDAMRNGEYRAVGELATNRLLNQIVRLQVDGRRCFVENENFRLAQKGTSETHQLPLSDTKEQ